MTENQQLWKIRVKAFSVNAGTGLVIVILGFLGSPDFHDLIIQYFGTSFITASVWLLLSGTVAQILNKLALKKLGARMGDSDVVLI